LTGEKKITDEVSATLRELGEQVANERPVDPELLRTVKAYALGKK
jgi:hypothetical protein